MKKLTLLFSILIFAFVLKAQDGYKVGDYIQDFKLLNTENGKMVSLSDFPNKKGFIITFTCNHCPYAKAYEDRIIALDNKFDKEGYPVIAISSNDPGRVPEDSPVNMKKRAEEKNYPFPYLFDETQEVAKRFGAKKTPHIFIVTRESNGKLKVRYIGTIDDSPMDAADAKKHYVEDAIAAIEQGKDPNPAVTYAIGCTIKWKE